MGSSVQTVTNGEKVAMGKKKKWFTNAALKESMPAKSVCKYPIDPKDVSANWNHLKNKVSSPSTKSTPKQKTDQNGTTKKGGARKKKRAKAKPGDASKPETQTAPNGTAGAQNNIWFDDVDPCLIKSSMISSSAGSTTDKLVKKTSFDGLTQFVAMDCEMVGTGFDGTNSVLARVSIVNLFGHCVYDKYVKPTEEVTDYRTEVSGIRPENLVNADDFKTVQKEVYDIIRTRILVGHSINHDLKVLFLSQPKHMIRDTSVYFRRFFNNRTPSLKKLTEVYLGVQIQHGEHDSITDAQATMRLYTLFKKKWQASLNRKSKRGQAKKTQTSSIQTPNNIVNT